MIDMARRPEHVERVSLPAFWLDTCLEAATVTNASLTAALGMTGARDVLAPGKDTFRVPT
jgi:hypothetical protein